MNFDQENFCKYVGSQGIRKSCDMTSLDNTRSISDYNFSKLNENDVLYVKLDKIPAFAQQIDKLKCKIVLVSGCSDYTTPNDLFSSEEQFLKFVNSSNITHWFVQNCIYTHPKITLMPIGLDYHSLTDQDRSYGKITTPLNQEKMLELIINKAKPFCERECKTYSNFHFFTNSRFGYDRIDAINQIPKDLIFYEQTKILRLNTFMNQIKYSFVISPHGNGLDCHRTWEALILGCIAIVKTSPLDSLYSELPVLIVNEWSEITMELLEKTVENYKNKKFNYDKLLLSWWTDKFFSFKQIKKIKKLKNAYFLSHNGLGDNIFMSSAVNYLSNFYENIYVLCKDKYKDSNIKLYESNTSVKILEFDSSDETKSCYNILNDKYLENDIFISGYHKSYLKSKISHSELVEYKINNRGYKPPDFLKEMTQFYYDINLDMSICVNNYKINICEDTLINELKNKYKLIFVHTEASDNEIDLSFVLDQYINNNNYLIISANKNYYNMKDEKYNLVNNYIKLNTIIDYCYIIINSEQIHIVNSCFSCLIYGLLMEKKIDIKKINIYDRYSLNKIKI